MPLYPEIRVKVRTSNPLVLVAAVRQALRHAGVDPADIRRFSDEALADRDLHSTRRVCSRWVTMSRA